MSDLPNLERFVEAQVATYALVLKELSEGKKRSHWMWFIFPQIQGLGSSEMARRYAIRSRTEARAYLDHRMLGYRLKECVDILLSLRCSSAVEVFGPIDELKLRSSMTLFNAVSIPEESIFDHALEKYFEGKPDSATLAILKAGE